MFDELASGLGSVSTPEIERSFGASHALATAMLFLVPGIVAFAVEPVLFVLADRHPRRWFIRGGVIAMAIASGVAAFAKSPVLVAASQALLWIAIGSASGLAQATLVDRSDERGRTLARWTLMSTIGDIAAPIVLVVCGGWRVGYGVCACVLAAWAIALCCIPIDGTGGDDDEERASIWDALRDRTLLAWLLACALCDLLDEILIVLASLHVRDDFGASLVWQTIVVVAFVIGGLVGLVILERVLTKQPERRVLIACCLACAASYAVWMMAPNVISCAVLIVPVGMFAAPLYPLASAQAYALRSSGLVLAASHVFTPLGLALPFLLGAAADRFGLPVALALITTAPISICILAIRQRKVQ
ncbi:MAG: MFS transporter [Kofleriaceae bacterium]